MQAATCVNAERSAKRIDATAKQPVLGEMCHRSMRFLRIPNIDRIPGRAVRPRRCLCWGDLRARFQFSLANPDRGGFGAPRTQPFPRLGAWRHLRSGLIPR